MKAQHIAAIIAINLFTIISITLVTQNPMTQPETTRTLTLTGIMGLMSFPTTYQGPPGPTSGQDPYVNSSAFVMTQSEGNSNKTYYLYCPTFHSEMLIGGGNGLAAGLTGDEIGGAYKAHLQVEVTGTPFKVTRWGNEYDLLNVSSRARPSIASHHLERLKDLGLVTRTGDGGYSLVGEVKLGVLRHFVRFGRILVPRFVLYASFDTVLTLLSLLFLPKPIDLLPSSFVVIIGGFSSAAFWYEAFRFWKLKPY
ncbi:MAG: hypothetical protein NTY03_04780 [Candidatus Bathyarchaeota archaeon]|nr:hypothetical protein [Candidatus Bathyarchaeota archaeon]